jgi:hypothetical protein
MPLAKHYGLTVGATYESRKGSRSPARTILWISADGGTVEYDSDAVADGRRFPEVCADAFAGWAALPLL